MTVPPATPIPPTTRLLCWRRLDVPGTDVCRLEATPDGGWRLRGDVVLHDEGMACALHYEATADARWLTLGGLVEGHCGGRPVRVALRRHAADRWTLNGAPLPLAAPCDDIDFGVTPATNLIAWRRMALPVGASGDSHAVWLDFPSMALRHLPQRYHRVDADHCDYDSPTTGYAGRLEIGDDGVVRRYPGLFERVAG